MIAFAAGIEEADRLNAGFATPDEAAAFWAEGAPEVPVEDLAYPAGGGQAQAARLYRGGGAGRPSLLYIHGGGWTGGSIALNERAARTLAVEGRCDVLSVSYRLSPAHPFPAGLEDCLAALDWLAAEGRALGLSGARPLIGGASAGANLAMAAALARGGRGIAGLVLFYGVFGADLDTPSYRRYAEGPGLTRARMAELLAMYDPGMRRHSDPLIAPLSAALPRALPPSLLIAAEHDVLLDDSREMHRALLAAGGSATLHVVPGVTHGFINRGRIVPAADFALGLAAGFLAGLPTTEQTA